MIYRGDRTAYGTAGQAFQTLLSTEEVSNQLYELTDARDYPIRWHNPRDELQNVLFVDPDATGVELHRPERFVVVGTCQVTRSEFEMKRGALGDVHAVWGTSSLDGQDYMIVGTRDPRGTEQVTVEHVKFNDPKFAGTQGKTRAATDGKKPSLPKRKRRPKQS